MTTPDPLARAQEHLERAMEEIRESQRLPFSILSEWQTSRLLLVGFFVGLSIGFIVCGFIYR